MRRYEVLAGGLLMVGAGAFLIFGTPQSLPLWFIWLAGPFLWYVGIATSIVGILIPLFPPRAGQRRRAHRETKEPEQIAVLHMHKFCTQDSPAGLIHEIPAMGSFLM
jgi:hypothetical protein